MKTTKWILFCLLLGITYTACDDTLSKVGLTIRPGADRISVFDTTITVGARTIEVDSVYAKTVYGFLGEFYDPSYGTIKSDYICQYYPSVGFPYPNNIVNNKIDSVRLNILYSSYIGDSLAPMELTIYPVVTALNKHYYTNADPKDYCDLSNPMAKYSYTARNMNVSDSALQAFGSYYLSIPLPVKLGQDYLNKVLDKTLTTVDEFLKFFPGTYITTTFGTGSMLPIDYTQIILYYRRNTDLKDVDGNDSIVVSSAAFTVTKEIIQLNSFKNTNPSSLLKDDPEKVYLKSPAGVFVELTIPVKEIEKGIDKKKFNSVRLSLTAYPKDEWKYSLPFPGIGQVGTYSSSKLLLIEPDSVKNFFEKQQLANGMTSYTTTFNSSTYSYDFNNIANLVQNAIDKAPGKDLKLWLIPVQTTQSMQSSPSGYQTYDYATSHYLYPSGVTLKKGGDNLKVRVIASDLTKE